MTSEFKKQNSISCLTIEKIITRYSFFPALWHMRENVQCQWFSSMSGVLETKERWQNLEGFFGLLLPPKVLKPRKILSEGILIFWFYCFCWQLIENASSWLIAVFTVLFRVLELAVIFHSPWWVKIPLWKESRVMPSFTYIWRWNFFNNLWYISEKLCTNWCRGSYYCMIYK